MQAEISFFKADGVSRLPSGLTEVRNWLIEVAAEFGYKGIQLNYIFMTDPELREMNKAYLNHDYETDVLTFDLRDKGTQKELNGEIYISLDRIRAQAKEYSVEFKNELMRVMVHGMLHLIGFNDLNTEENVLMRSEEDKALAKFFT